jgi:hypothetical protein
MKEDEVNGLGDRYGQVRRVFIPWSSNGHIKGGTATLARPARKKSEEYASLAKG